MRARFSVARWAGIEAGGVPGGYRELFLGVVLGLLLAIVAVAIDIQRPSLGPTARPLSVIAFFVAGVGFGVLLWVVSRRERASRRIHQRIANVTAGGVVVNDKQGVVVFANAKFCEMVGRSPSEVLGKRFTELIAPDSS